MSFCPTLNNKVKFLFLIAQMLPYSSEFGIKLVNTMQTQLKVHMFFLSFSRFDGCLVVSLNLIVIDLDLVMSLLHSSG